MKLDHIPSEEEIQELLNAGVSFEEEILDNGYLAVNWSCPSKRDWSRTLHLVKNSIPKLGRNYDKETKRWIIAPDYIHLFEQIKINIQKNPDADFTSVDSAIESELLINTLGAEFRNMSQGMREKAKYVFDHAISTCKEFGDGIVIEVEYCFSENTFGVFNPESNNWYYSNGRYSGYSPQEKDDKARQKAYHELWLKIQAFEQDTLSLDAKSIYLPTEKQLFRLKMLGKYNHKCFVCKLVPSNESSLHMHRVIPGKNGGEYVESNVVILCRKCHKRFEGATWEEIHTAHNQLIGE